MNVKIYKNVILDMIVVMFDIIIVLGSGIIGFSVIRYISPNFEKDYIQIVTYLALDLFTLWAYELYTSVIRDNYELKLSVILSNILAACGCIIFIVVRDLLVIHSIRWYLCLNTIFMAVITSLIIYAEKRLYVKLIKSFEGNVKLLILDDSTQENDFARTWHLLQRLCMRCANGPVRPASPSGSVARHPRQASVGGRRMASGVSSPVLRSLLPCPMSGCALRSPSAYFAESTRVLAAEYNSPLRKAFPRFSVVAPSFSRRRCRFIRPGVGNDGGGASVPDGRAPKEMKNSV